MFKTRALALFAGLFLLPLTCRAAIVDTLSLAASLREDVYFLADSLREGRATGTKGAQDAAFYILGRMKQEGLATRVQCFESNNCAGHNLIGECREGRETDKWILVFAYYDGYGMLGDVFHPGADANASGVAAMLNLIPGLRGNGKNILFVALDGHHHGLTGAKALMGLGYRISQVVNIDAVGSTLAPPQKFYKEYLIALGTTSRQRTIMHALNGSSPDGGPFEKGKTGLHLYFDYYGSRTFTDMFYRRINEQAPFVEKAIPAVMFTSGITMKTGRYEDDAASLDYPVFARRVELIRQWILAI